MGTGTSRWAVSEFLDYDDTGTYNFTSENTLFVAVIPAFRPTLSSTFKITYKAVGKYRNDLTES